MHNCAKFMKEFRALVNMSIHECYHGLVARSLFYYLPAVFDSERSSPVAGGCEVKFAPQGPHHWRLVGAR